MGNCVGHDNGERGMFDSFIQCSSQKRGDRTGRFLPLTWHRPCAILYPTSRALLGIPVKLKSSIL